MKPVIALIVTVALLPAQTFRGAISGSVSDRSGAAISAAEVKGRNLTNGLVRITTSTATGDFLLPELPSGAYEIEVSKDGFQAQRTERVEVPVSVTLTLRFTLNVSEQRTTVDVVDTATVEASNSTLNTVVSPQQVQNLPLNGRDFLRLIRLSPGVTLFGPSAYAVNGSRGRSNNFQIDGADNNDAWQNASAGNQGGVSAVPNTLVPIEAIAVLDPDKLIERNGPQQRLGHQSRRPERHERTARQPLLFQSQRSVSRELARCAHWVAEA